MAGGTAWTATPTTAIRIMETGFGNPTADGTTSVGDKLILWNRTDEPSNSGYGLKEAIGLDTNGLTLQANGNGSSHIGFWTGPGPTGTAPLERMRINASGDVGIGTTNPLAALSVVTQIPWNFGGASSTYWNAFAVGVVPDTTTDYILLYPYSTVTSAYAAGFAGFINCVRGGASSSNALNQWHFLGQNAYGVNDLSIEPMGVNTGKIPIYTVTYSGTTYIAISGADVEANNGGAGCTMTMEGQYWNGINSITPFMEPSASLSSISSLVNYSYVGPNISTLNSNSYVGIGTAAPSAPLSVAGYMMVTGAAGIGPTSQGTYIDWNNTGGQGEADLISNKGGGNGGFYFYNANSSGTMTELATINYSTGAYTAVSDRRLKTDLTPIEDSLDKILSLNGYTYYWKDKENRGNARQIGVVAQEVEKVFPEAVATDSKSGLKSVGYSQLVAPLIGAVKELYAKLMHTNDRMNDLEKRLTAVESSTTVSGRAPASTGAAASTGNADATQLKNEVDRLKSENAAMKTYLCAKDPNAAFCKK